MTKEEIVKAIIRILKHAVGVLEELVKKGTKNG